MSVRCAWPKRLTLTLHSKQGDGLDTVLQNAIYFGDVKHERYVESGHRFKYRVFLLWLRVAEVDQPQLRFPLVSRRRFGIVSLRASDYMAHRSEGSLQARLQGEINAKLGKIWTGEAYLLAQPRYLGFVMNPLALFYCYDSSGELAFVVGEITNTPWGERHCYVFDMNSIDQKRSKDFTFPKEFHVSPFLPMNMEYTWRLTAPSQYLAVGIWNRVDGRLDFEAHMTLQRVALKWSTMMKYLLKMPLMTWKIWFGIYLNAGILYLLKRVTFYSHPKKTEL